SPFFILSGGNQPSSNPVHLAKGRRSRDYVMFVQWSAAAGPEEIDAVSAAANKADLRAPDKAR
ncbi:MULTISPECIES: hypothetical protein, partial [unclassified Sphingobium]|uniref:hypothetical protein n=1 Tax=unclassified Sphingobium TaxID=2611147 RepID=UPI001C955AD6